MITTYLWHKQRDRIGTVMSNIEASQRILRGSNVISLEFCGDDLNSMNELDSFRCK